VNIVLILPDYLSNLLISGYLTTSFKFQGEQETLFLYVGYIISTIWHHLYSMLLIIVMSLLQ